MLGDFQGLTKTIRIGEESFSTKKELEESQLTFLSCFVTPSWVMSYDDHDAGRASERLWSVHRRPALFSFSGHRRVRSIRNLEGEE